MTTNVQTFTLGQAAKATGKSKPTISKAIKEGRLTGRKQPNGEYEIEPSELFRVYPKLSEEPQEKDKLHQAELEIRTLKGELAKVNSVLDYKSSQLTKQETNAQQWQRQLNNLLESNKKVEEENRSKQQERDELFKKLCREEVEREKYQLQLEQSTKELSHTSEELNEHRETVQMLQASRIGRWLLNRQGKHKGIERLPKQPSKAKTKKQAVK